MPHAFASTLHAHSWGHPLATPVRSPILHSRPGKRYSLNSCSRPYLLGWWSIKCMKNGCAARQSFVQLLKTQILGIK